MIERLSKEDIGRYVLQKSTGEVGVVRQDPGNGWIHPEIVYEWELYRNDLEFVHIVSEEEMLYFKKLEKLSEDILINANHNKLSS